MGERGVGWPWEHQIGWRTCTARALPRAAPNTSANTKANTKHNCKHSGTQHPPTMFLRPSKAQKPSAGLGGARVGVVMVWGLRCRSVTGKACQYGHASIGGKQQREPQHPPGGPGERLPTSQAGTSQEAKPGTTAPKQLQRARHNTGQLQQPGRGACRAHPRATSASWPAQPSQPCRRWGQNTHRGEASWLLLLRCFTSGE